MLCEVCLACDFVTGDELDNEIDQAEKEAEDKLKDLERQFEDDLEDLKDEQENKLAEMEKEAKDDLEELKKEQEEALSQLESKVDDELSEIEKKVGEAISELGDKLAAEVEEKISEAVDSIETSSGSNSDSSSSSTPGPSSGSSYSSTITNATLVILDASPSFEDKKNKNQYPIGALLDGVCQPKQSIKGSCYVSSQDLKTKTPFVKLGMEKMQVERVAILMRELENKNFDVDNNKAYGNKVVIVSFN